MVTGYRTAGMKKLSSHSNGQGHIQRASSTDEPHQATATATATAGSGRPRSAPSRSKSTTPTSTEKLPELREQVCLRLVPSRPSFFFRLQEGEKALLLFFYCKRKKLGRLGTRLGMHDSVWCCYYKRKVCNTCTIDNLEFLHDFYNNNVSATA